MMSATETAPTIETATVMASSAKVPAVMRAPGVAVVR